MFEAASTAVEAVSAEDVERVFDQEANVHFGVVHSVESVNG